MSFTRLTAWTLFAAVGFALLAPSPVAAQDPPLPKKPDTSGVISFRDAQRGGIPKSELPKAQAAFKAFAKYYADVVAHPAVWKASQDPKPVTVGAGPVPTLEGTEGIFKEIDRFLIDTSSGGSKINLEPFDYIREMGAAFDGALKNLIDTSAEPIVRINAARLLAHVARTGAPAHYPTVTALLANANTRTEVKYYLFQAAGALLAAPDPYEPKVRRHAANAATIGALVKALEDCVTKPEMLVAGIVPGKPGTITEDQLAVIGFVRRQAVRALGETKFVTVPGPDGKTPLYPAYTLVRVAMSDPALVPAPSPGEAADAAIGLCNMAPAVEQLKGGFRPVKEYNGDVAAEAVTAALVTFAKPRAARADDKTLPWRAYAARIAEALKNWRPLFDPDFEPTQPAKFNAALIPAAVEELNRDVVPKVLAPMDRTDGARVEIEGLQKRLVDLRARPKRNTLLFANVPTTTIEFAPPKK